MQFVELPMDWSDTTQVFQLAWSEWPQKLLPIADGGDGIHWCLDCRSTEAPVFRVAPGEFDWRIRRVPPNACDSQGIVNLARK